MPSLRASIRYSKHCLDTAEARHPSDISYFEQLVARFPIRWSTMSDATEWLVKSHPDATSANWCKVLMITFLGMGGSHIYPNDSCYVPVYSLAVGSPVSSISKLRLPRLSCRTQRAYQDCLRSTLDKKHRARRLSRTRIKTATLHLEVKACRSWTNLIDP